MGNCASAPINAQPRRNEPPQSRPAASSGNNAAISPGSDPKTTPGSAPIFQFQAHGGQVTEAKSGNHVDDDDDDEPLPVILTAQVVDGQEEGEEKEALDATEEEGEEGDKTSVVEELGPDAVHSVGASRYAVNRGGNKKVFYIPPLLHSLLIGTGGAVKKSMESANRVSVDFPPRHSPGPVVTVFGDNDAIDKWRIDAQSRIRFNPSTSMYLTAQLQLPNRVNLSPIKGAGFSVLKEIERAHGVNLDLPRASGDPIKALGTERDIKRVTKQLSQMLGTTITVGSVSGGGSSNQTGAIGASLKNLVVDPYKKIDFDFKETNMIIETLFFPDDDSVPPAGFPGTKGNWKYDRFLQYIKSTTKTLDIAIYNLTYDRTRDALLELHKKGVKVRIVGCASNIDSEGNDIRELASAGVKVTILDLAKPGTKAGSSSYNKHSDAFLMHHKFAILDGKLALNGSFNWSKSAAFGNHENIVFSNIPTFVEPFKQHFEKIYAAGKPLK